ncbi:MAG: glycosyltransferase [Flavobacterium sp.]|jgi:hypothetical protein
MRVGFNPNKDKILPKSDYTHQVIIPVYIPHQNDYFKDSFQILRFCLESLIITIHAKTYITVVNNGSCEEVIVYLNQLHKEKKIQEVIHSTSIGKLNAILKGITGHQFPLITITDADVLFLNHWQKATYEVFEAFPKTGLVCTTPSSKSFNDKTFNILFQKLFSKNLVFSKVKNPAAFEAFASSIGNPNFYKSVHFEKYLTLTNHNVRAIVGAGHFVATYRGNIFSDLGVTATPFSLGGTSEAEILDLPVIRKGYWRLSTDDNYTYHLGNVQEAWMKEIFDSLEKEDKGIDFVLHKPLKQPSRFQFWVNNKLPEKLFYRKGIRRLFLKYKGLTEEQAKTF